MDWVCQCGGPKESPLLQGNAVGLHSWMSLRTAPDA